MAESPEDLVAGLADAKLSEKDKAELLEFLDPVKRKNSPLSFDITSRGSSSGGKSSHLEIRLERTNSELSEEDKAELLEFLDPVKRKSSPLSLKITDRGASNGGKSSHLEIRLERTNPE
ncbi:hypothetical protein [uncultured Paludibaculum sp.]|uniref:hypothetical protein n=1 Tax=uncultured Paludibaculum sp. TaxID=1765020 RepID=UPI002AAB2C73|nr:hypothetical protein [uncultured Paludibaculum sp.]